ncbi:MAG: hypothetical protein V3573_08735 [Desulfovibrionaceae bacterium]
MHLTLKFDTKDVDWTLAAAIYEEAGFKNRNAENLQQAFAASDGVCFAFDMNRMIGLCRVAEQDGKPALLDLCIVPSYKGFGLGHTMHDYLSRKYDSAVPVRGTDETETAFYKGMEMSELLD